MLDPFFAYYGGKWRIAPRYPWPDFDTIIEPFAGSAGYALRYYGLKVQLFDANPIVVGVWDYLIRASREEVRSLPLIFDSVDDVHAPQEAKWFIGFWMNAGVASPCKKPSKWMRQGLKPHCFWGEYARDRISRQVDFIRHWSVREREFAEIENLKATWFIDPPYEAAGRHYPFQVTDYVDLAAWSRTRYGQVIVCENEGASWLPFKPFHAAKANSSSGRGKKSLEAAWFANNHCADLIW
jgi:hypothetical protein